MAAASGSRARRPRPATLDRVSEVLFAATDLEHKVDEDKVKALRAQRDEQRKVSQRLSAQIKLENRKKKRLLAKVAGLPNQELLESLRIRFQAENKRAEAKRIRQELEEHQIKERLEKERAELEENS